MNTACIAIAMIVMTMSLMNKVEARPINRNGFGCGVDEYYDGVIDLCANCSNVCKNEANIFCFINCPFYHEREFGSTTTVAPIQADPTDMSNVVIGNIILYRNKGRKHHNRVKVNKVSRTTITPN